MRVGTTTVTTVEIRLEVRHGLEYYRGRVFSSTGETLHETTRWSEGALRQALVHYIYRHSRSRTP